MLKGPIKQNKLMRFLIVAFSALLLTACSKASAAKKPMDETVPTTAAEISTNEVDID